MYANFNTDKPEVLPCNRNNCRCGNDQNCMYYNNPENGHYNYFAVNGAGDRNSPFYQCPSVAYDTYNQEQVYDDQTLQAGTNELGAYNDLTPYGGVNDPKGFYGPAPVSYMDKPTCSGNPNKAQMTPQAMDRDADYDKWDRYHRYRKYQLKDNTIPALLPESQSSQPMLPPLMLGNLNLTPWLILLGAQGAVLYMQRAGMVSNQAAMIIAIVILLLFFLPFW